MPAHSAAASPSKDSRGAYIELTQGQEAVWSAGEIASNETGELSRLSAEVSAVQQRARCLLWCTAGLVGALCLCLGLLFATWSSMHQASEDMIALRVSVGTLEKTTAMQSGATTSMQATARPSSASASVVAYRVGQAEKRLDALESSQQSTPKATAAVDSLRQAVTVLQHQTASSYTRAQVDSALANKLDADAIKISSVSKTGTVTPVLLGTLAKQRDLILKANTADVYTRTQIDALLEKAESDQQTLIGNKIATASKISEANAASQLGAKADASAVYTR